MAVEVDYVVETVEEREARYARILALINLLRPQRLAGGWDFTQPPRKRGKTWTTSHSP